MKPPYKTIIVILLAIMIMLLTTMVKQYGEIVAFVVGILSIATVIIAGFIWLWRYFVSLSYRKSPFIMWFTEYPYSGKQLHNQNLIIPLGLSSVTIEVQPKRMTQFQEIYMMLVNRKFNRNRLNESADYPDVAIIRIKDIKVDNRDATTFHTILDRANGIRGYFEPSFRRLPKQRVRITIDIEANKQWNGLVRFESECEGALLGDAYVQLSVDTV